MARSWRRTEPTKDADAVETQPISHFFFFFFFHSGSAPSCFPSWSAVNVDRDLDRDSQEYLEALAGATAELQDYVTLCKSHLMMETCFDVTGQQVELLSREAGVALH